MSVRIDLSSNELNSNAVDDFLKAHTGIGLEFLFQISKDAFDLVISRAPQPQVAVSAEEATEINEFLGCSYGPDQYRASSGMSCNNCNRTLNFFDIFKTGIQRHGADYVRRYLGGTAYYYHARAAGELDIICTNCGRNNERIFGPYYSKPTYSCNY